MDLTMAQGEREFADQARAWLGEHHPGPEPMTEEGRFTYFLDWQKELYAGGWLGLTWPAEHGGRGLTEMEQALFNAELARVRAPMPLNIVGLQMGGPVLLAHGTEAQKQRYLDGILSGEEIWCQGFSEPGAGSDLAALRTRARRTDGGWLASGQKVWTSFAHKSEWCMLLARTDPDSAKHRGITFFLLNVPEALAAGTAQIRPLRQITGESEFNELFLDDAFIPDDNVVGGIGDGWNVAITTLMYERAGLGTAHAADIDALVAELVDLANARGEGSDPFIRSQIGRLKTDAEVMRLIGWQVLTDQLRTGSPGAGGSYGKWLWADANKEISELGYRLSGSESPEERAVWEYRLLRSRANSIEGGTTEIQKNIVAERILGLPRSR